MGTHENRFDYKVCVLGIEAKGRGTSKQIGKQNAAHNALMLLKDKGIYNPDENPVQELKTPSHNTNLPESPFKDSPNCIVSPIPAARSLFTSLYSFPAGWMMSFGLSLSCPYIACLLRSKVL
ncbi:hypothetical protein NQ317_003557 [Molorchus minor]|uniref:DRBM domain-containing protein n=1 Tax=Molorchus minor TaxID=1323400 RepID=A0ABQ9ITW6_9CUCU|nr:hypothetical protein NQ317_003557 [Molorchus minor]